MSRVSGERTCEVRVTDKASSSHYLSLGLVKAPTTLTSPHRSVDEVRPRHEKLGDYVKASLRRQ